jgi:hypothetical protein
MIEKVATSKGRIYNGRIAQQALGHLTPMDCLKAWYCKAPGLFQKKPNDLPGLDKSKYFKDR